MSPQLNPTVDISASVPARFSDLVCPQCTVPLKSTEITLQCPKCLENWPVVDGVPHFVREFPYWGEIGQKEMREVIQTACAGNWRAALTDSADESVQRAAVMMLNLERANWHWLANLPPDTRALDLGAGTGTTSHALALHYREIVAVEPVQERVEFMRQRFAQERLSNVNVVRSSIWVLPFAPESFDLIIMNGVLEWVAAGSSEDPRELQTRALRNALRLLKPGGCLYVGIENRTTPGYFIGHPDPHCGLPFVTILPRPLAHWYARRKGHSAGYRNYLYSSRGYRKLLQEAGFRDLEIYLALPSYNHPRFLIPLAGNAFAYYDRTFNSSNSGRLRSIARKLLVKVNLLKHMEYSYAIFAHK